MSSSRGKAGLLSPILTVAGSVTLLCGAALAGYLYGINRPREQTDSPDTVAPTLTRITARGRIEPTSGILNVAVAVPDRLEKLDVEEGAMVKKDQEVGWLASHKLRRIERDLARAQLEEADERLKRTLAHLRLQIQEADRRAEQLKTQGDLDVEVQKFKLKVFKQQLEAGEDLLRRMRQAGSYSAQEIKQQELLVNQTREEFAGSEAVLRKIESANATNLRTAETQREVALAGLEKAKAEMPRASLQQGVELAEERLRQTVLRAPAAGRVLKVLTRAGEMTGAQPVFQMADTRSMVVLAEVYETEVNTVREWARRKEKMPVKVLARFSTGAPTEFSGTVERIGEVVKRNSLFSLDPRQDLDARVFEVRVALDDEHHKQAAGFIHMQVDVIIPNPQGAAATNR